MDIYEFAKKFEMDGREYYLKLAKESSSEYLAQLFNMLANDERQHYEIVSKLQENDAEYVPSDNFGEVRTIFRRYLDANETFEAEITKLEAYAHAVELEKESFDFYREQGEKANNPVEREILYRIANEEMKHQIMLENLMDLIRKPEEWVESPEFSHLPEYDHFTDMDVY